MMFKKTINKMAYKSYIKHISTHNLVCSTIINVRIL